ncbi:MAG: hypothetical protein HUJ69_02780 [Lachnospiraceae bacterium]|nr:hypothetical protein [Lachnospiraceae bacterium]
MDHLQRNLWNTQNTLSGQSKRHDRKVTFRRFLLSLVLTLCLASTTGCISTGGKEEDRQIQLGKKLMQDYLTAYIPGGKVLEAHAHTEEELGFGTKVYLTEYVCGTYEDEDGVWEFEVNTETGKLYSTKYYVKLKELVGQKILEHLELEEGAEITYMGINYTALPHHCEAFGHDDDSIEFFGEPTDKPYAKYATLSFLNVLPIAMVDVEGYLAREDRPTMYIYLCKISLPEGVVPPELSEDMFPICWDGLQVDKIVFE